MSISPNDVIKKQPLGRAVIENTHMHSPTAPDGNREVVREKIQLELTNSVGLR